MLGGVLMLVAGVVAVDDPKATVRVDEARREVIVTAGPFHVEALPPGVTHEAMDMMDDHNTPVIRFEWPVQGWVRGFKVEVVDGDGRSLDRRLIHHLIGLNFDRRQLLYPAVERLFGIGQETDDASVPRSIGVPMSPGTQLGMYMAWQNESGRDLHGVQIRVRFEYSPPNLNPRPVDALPIYMDANLTIGVTNAFDVLPGRTEQAWEFTMPLGGRLLGFGGHLHDFGTAVRLEEVETGKVSATVKATRTPEGKVTGISRGLPGVRGDGIQLREGRRYRVVGIYDNPTQDTIRRGAMAHIVGLFAPDDIGRWPKLDPGDETLQADLASLDRMGKAATGHGHESHP
jgi:hypothetical protein